ncbi:MAG: DJ-1/PfpI family protein [Candidatus Heimdallarchaeota archaeon]|nr:DJ-1/PfpI family protein [Candidatus Heimdallarchaeota archaeon]
MSCTILLVLEEGFNDLSFLTIQTLLEENSHDIIISSSKSDAIKGIESSVMTVSLDDALNHEIDYKAIILVGGNSLNNWDLLNETLKKFSNENKLIGAVENGVSVLQELGLSNIISTGDDVIFDNSILSLGKPENIENFVERLISLL